jgi:serralysin
MPCVGLENFTMPVQYSQPSPETQVNTTTLAFQGNPEVAAFSDGRYVVVWNDESGLGGDASVSGVKAQIYAANGTAIGAEFLINQQTSESQTVRSLAILSDNRFVVSWTSVTPGVAESSDSRARIFDTNGMALTNEFSVSLTSPGHDDGAYVEAVPGGGFVAAWTSTVIGQTVIDSDVWAQVFAPDGSRVGSDFRVNSQTAYGQGGPRIAVLDNGNFVITWTDGSGIFGDVPTALDKSGTGAVAQIFSPTGVKIGTEFLVNDLTGLGQGPTDIASLANSGFIVTWSDYSDGSNDENIRARVFDNSGVAQGPSFRINATITGPQQNGRVIATPDGGFIALWTDGSLRPDDSSDYAVRMRYFSGPDAALGDAQEILVNTTTFGSQLSANLTLLPNGTIVAVWEHYSATGGDGSGPSIKQQLLAVSSYATGSGALNGTFNIDYLAGLSGDDILSGFGGNDVLDGNAGNDILSGGAGRDELFGRGGNDQLFDGGGADADSLFGGAGDDIYIVENAGSSTIEGVGEGTDTVQTGFFSYALQANIENLTLTGNAGHGAGVGNALDNLIVGGAGTDDLFGRAGNDVLRGGVGNANTLLGQDGNDVYIVEAAGDSVIEFANDGTDRVETALQSFVLRDHVEDLVFTGTDMSFIGIGNNGANRISGGNINDFLDGRDGDDILIGGQGQETLIGGAGNDQFLWLASHAGWLDRILDFTSGEDRIMLESASFFRTTAVDFVAGASATSANSTFHYDTTTGIVRYDADGTGSALAIEIAQLNAGLTLTGGDFGFY